jgi:hypothetical protein
MRHFRMRMRSQMNCIRSFFQLCFLPEGSDSCQTAMTG